MIASSPFLRRALALDALASGATGLSLAAGGEFVAGLLGLEVAVTRPLGLFFVGYAGVIAWLASRALLPAGAVWAVIALNAAWMVESFVSLATGFIAPSAAGIVLLSAQALAVGGFAYLQFVGLRRSPRLAR